MKLARIDDGDVPDFAIENGGRWYRLRDVGLDVADTPDLVRRHREISEVTIDPGLPAVDTPRFVAPIVRPAKMLGIGLNYLDHIREAGKEPLEHPFVFAKFPSSIAGPTDEVRVDGALTRMCDWEVELAVVIGARTRDVSVEDAHDAVFGYLVANDLSARDWQELPGQFSRSKSFDGFCPMGPWITTADEVEDPQDLRLTCAVNGEVRQDSTTAEMLHSVAALVSFLSRGTTLEPGDVVLTGTPHGVGLGMEPPVYLEDGDVVRCVIEGLGELTNRIVVA